MAKMAHASQNAALLLHGSCTEDVVVLFHTRLPCQGASLQVQQHNSKPSFLSLSCSMTTK